MAPGTGKAKEDPIQKIGAMIEEKIAAALAGRDRTEAEAKDPWARIEGLIDRTISKHFEEFSNALHEGSAAGRGGAARAIVNKAGGNAQTIGALLAAFPFTAHTGLTIAGMVDPQTKRVVVRSRAVVAGEILLGQLAAATSQDELQRAAQIL